MQVRIEASQAANIGYTADYPGGTCAPPGCCYYHFGVFLDFIDYPFADAASIATMDSRSGSRRPE